MQKLGGSLYTACQSPSDAAAREAMLLGSCQAGMAFSNASVTLIHGMSRPLGALFHIPHGMCNAMLLPRCISFSAEGAVARYAEASRMLGLCSASATDDDAAGGFARALHKVTSDLEVPTLQGFGVDETVFRQAVPRMATAALASGSPGNNPVVPSQAQVEVLFHELWDHECRASTTG